MAKKTTLSGLFLPQLTFEGTVYSGRGTGKNFVALSWVKQQIIRNIGFPPYYGTLNIRLTEQSKDKKKQLETKQGFVVEPQTGYHSGILFHAQISGLKCAVILPLVLNYPSDLLEIIAPQYLRGKLGLKDGDRVTVVVTVS